MIQQNPFDQEVYRLASLVPPGKVTTYGQLAMLAGKPGWARRAGQAMSRAPAERPCHRVVNSAGRLVPGWGEQRQLLRDEGVTFRPSGNVDMKKHRMQFEDWDRVGAGM